MIDVNKHRENVKKKLKCNNEELDKIMKTATERLQQFSTLPESEQEVRLKNILSFILRKKLTSNAKTYEGLFLFDGEVRINNEKQINEILDTFHRDSIKKQEYLDNGVVKLIDGNPVVYDTRETFASGAKNWNYGKPIAKQPRKTIIGIVKIGETDFKKMNLILSDEDCRLKIVCGKVCEFTASMGKDSEDGTKNLYLAGNSQIEYKDKDVNVLEILTNFYKENWIPAKFLKSSFAKDSKETRGFKLHIFNAELINDNSQSANPNIKVSVPMDFDELLNSNDAPESIYVKLPQNIANTFDAKPDSIVTIVGTCWEVGEDENKFFGVSAKGVFYSEKKVETKPIEKVSTGNEW